MTDAKDYDPNENLAEIRLLLSGKNYTDEQKNDPFTLRRVLRRLDVLFQELDRSLKNGGVMPKDWLPKFQGVNSGRCPACGSPYSHLRCRPYIQQPRMQAYCDVKKEFVNPEGRTITINDPEWKT